MTHLFPTNNRFHEQTTGDLAGSCPAAACVLEAILQTLRTSPTSGVMHADQWRKDALQTAWEAYAQMQELLRDWEQQLRAYQAQETRQERS